MSEFLFNHSSISIFYACEQRRLWCWCADSPEPSLVAYMISTISSWAGSYGVQLGTKVNRHTVSRSTYNMSMEILYDDPLLRPPGVYSRGWESYLYVCVWLNWNIKSKFIYLFTWDCCLCNMILIRKYLTGFFFRETNRSISQTKWLSTSTNIRSTIIIINEIQFLAPLDVRKQAEVVACTNEMKKRHLDTVLRQAADSSTCYSRNFKTLASLISWAGRFESYLVENPKDSFSRDVAPISMTPKCNDTHDLVTLSGDKTEEYAEKLNWYFVKLGRSNNGTEKYIMSGTDFNFSFTCISLFRNIGN